MHSFGKAEVPRINPQRLVFGEGQNPRKIGRKDGMEWSQSEVLSLAQLSCAVCIGEGTIKEKGGKILPCSCVLRAVFRACYARFRHCVAKEKNITRASPEMVAGKDGRMAWGRKDEEYIADFCLVSRRALVGLDYKVFKFHFLLGANWKLCTRKLNLDRGDFFHAVYRVSGVCGGASENSNRAQANMAPPSGRRTTSRSGCAIPRAYPAGLRANNQDRQYQS